MNKRRTYFVFALILFSTMNFFTRNPDNKDIASAAESAGVTPTPTEAEVTNSVPDSTPTPTPSTSAIVATNFIPELPGGEAPLGPNSFVFYGTTVEQNRFMRTTNFGAPGVVSSGRAPGLASPAAQPSLVDVLILTVDTNDHRFTGSTADLTNYQNMKKNDFDANFGPFWMENSFGKLNIVDKMPSLVLNMSGAFDDYFNRDWVPVTLTSQGLNLLWAPNLTLGGNVSVTFHVRDKYDRNDDVTLNLASGTYSKADLTSNCQSAFNAIRMNWVICSMAGNELRIKMEDLMVKEGSFIRVRGGTNLPALGFNGPTEEPGNSTNITPDISLVSKSLSGFPLTTTTNAQTKITIRDQRLRTRTYTINLPAATYSKTQIDQAFLQALNTEFNWVEAFDPGSNRLGLRLKSDFKGINAAIRISGGVNLNQLGMDGPLRADGVITFDSRQTVRGDGRSMVSEALSLFVLNRAQANGISIDQINRPQLDALVQTELGGFDSFLILFIDEHLAEPIPGRRAGASPTGHFNLNLQGSFVYQKQIQAAFMIGTGAEDWQTWTHELGHVVGLWDLYAKAYYDPQFIRDFDYTNEWEMMNSHWGGAHTDAWHSVYFNHWIPTAEVRDIMAPAAGATETTRFTLAPLEFPLSDYTGAGTTLYPLQHVARIRLSEKHWIFLSNRQPGIKYSQNLPGTFGFYPPAISPNAGGLFVTDTLDPWAPFLYRSPVTTLNPDGTNRAKAMDTGDVLDLSASYPAYDGIKITVIDSPAGPPGYPDVVQVEVERGPGDFVDLEIRPWQAPTAYATNDIWIDWPGNGAESYPGEPPLGNGDTVHWNPDGTALNQIKIRVHNRGTVDAKNVVTKAFVNEPMGMGDRGTFVELNTSPSQAQDIPAGGFRDFSFDWRPTAKGHTCIRAEISTFSGPLGDLDPTNNFAQENITDFGPTAGSPYKPYSFTFKVNNDYDVPVNVMLMPTGLIKGMVLELENAYVNLGPDEEVTLNGRLFLDNNEIPPEYNLRLQREMTHLSFNIHGLISNDEAFLPFGGVTINVDPGYESRLELEGLLLSRVDVASLPTDEEKLLETYGEGLQQYPQLVDFYRANGDFPPDYLARVSQMKEPTVVISGLLTSKDPGADLQGETVDAVLIDQKNNEWSGTGLVINNGRFYVRVGPAAPGAGRLMLYYFGPKAAATELGPIDVIVP